ncbi:MAG: PHP domain-containing protein [Bradymonadales bacterium]|nr:PHP domain-containing protein [Bradymonadales bacterium]
MTRFHADLHIHSALSPCASEEMTPMAIVEAALEKGLDMIAICDHNASGNAAATQEAAGNRLAVIAGMELTTAEEIHLVGLFPDAGSAEAAAGKAAGTLPPVTQESRRFGRQLLMNARGEVIGEEKRMLSAATTLDLADATALIRHHGGLVIAAHINRPSYSVFSQLGLFPTEVQFDAVELAQVRRDPPWQAEIAALSLPVFHSSDSHFLHEIGKATTCLELFQPVFEELVLAIQGVGGRTVIHA